MAKSESEAAALFRKKLADVVLGANIIYVISDEEYIQNGGNACFTRVSAVSLCTFVAYLSLNPARRYYKKAGKMARYP